jgi:hypothetical protein
MTAWNNSIQKKMPAGINFLNARYYITIFMKNSSENSM